MLASEVIKVAIERPFAEVYEFLSDASNLTKWASMPDADMQPLAGGDWLVDLPRGQMVVRITPRNSFGILDYQLFKPGEPGGPVVSSRLIRNGDGCELVIVRIKAPELSGAEFASEVEWLTADLLLAKTLLESRHPARTQKAS